MHKFIAILLAVGLFCGTSVAQAGGSHAHVGLGHWSNHVGFHYGYHGRVSDVLGVIAGGILLGSILDYAFSPRHHHAGYHDRARGHSYSRNQRYDYHHQRHRSPRRFHEPAGAIHESRPPVYREVAMRREYRHSQAPLQQTHLHRDRYGNCFEISYAADGAERRQERPKSDCAW